MLSQARCISGVFRPQCRWAETQIRPATQVYANIMTYRELVQLRFPRLKQHNISLTASEFAYLRTAYRLPLRTSKLDVFCHGRSQDGVNLRLCKSLCRTDTADGAGLTERRATNTSSSSETSAAQVSSSPPIYPSFTQWSSEK